MFTSTQDAGKSWVIFSLNMAAKQKTGNKATGLTPFNFFLNPFCTTSPELIKKDDCFIISISTGDNRESIHLDLD